MEKPWSRVVAGLCVVALVLVAITGGIRVTQRFMAKHEVYQVLLEGDRSQRLQTLRNMTESSPAAMAALLDALNEPDLRLRSRAAWTLSLLSPGKVPRPAVASALTSHMVADPSDEIRLCCAIGLMWDHSDQVERGYIQALSDKYDKVVTIACGQLGARRSTESTAALFKVLAHPSWRIRLEACKSLITQKTADQRVVGTLEQMAGEPEAQTYDAEVEKFDAMFRQMESERPKEPRIARWGKIGAILDQARTIAGQHS